MLKTPWLWASIVYFQPCYSQEAASLVAGLPGSKPRLRGSRLLKHSPSALQDEDPVSRRGFQLLSPG